MPTREDQKRHDEEMLLVHKPGAAADPKKVGGMARAAAEGPAAAKAPRAASLDKQELDLMKKQIGMTKDPAARRELLGQIQHKFGNEKAGEVVRELRLQPTDDDVKAKAAHGAGGTKKGKS